MTKSEAIEVVDGLLGKWADTSRMARDSRNYIRAVEYQNRCDACNEIISKLRRCRD